MAKRAQQEYAYASCIPPSKRCYFTFDFYTKLTSTAKSLDNNNTYVFLDENNHHSRLRKRPFRGSIVPNFFPEPHGASRQHLQVCTPCHKWHVRVLLTC